MWTTLRTVALHHSRFLPNSLQFISHAVECELVGGSIEMELEFSRQIFGGEKSSNIIEISLGAELFYADART
jgi:hypothetical protein